MPTMQRINITKAGALAAAILMISAGAASAESDDDNPFAKARTHIGVGMLVGGYSVGPVSGAAVGMHLDLGRQMGPLALLGEYNMLSIGESSLDSDDPIRGIQHRFALNARYNFVDFGGGQRTPVQGAVWLEGGLGRQIIAWNEGGRLTRDDIGLGFGVQTNFRVSKRDDKKPKFMSVHYAFRATIAKSPIMTEDAPVTCGGPCDEPTGPSPYDLGLFFNMGVVFGK